MPKRGTFLLIVQTTVLANATSLASQPAKAEQYRHELSAAGERIPDTLGAAEAASEFCRFMLDHLREDKERATGRKMEPPTWLAHA